MRAQPFPATWRVHVEKNIPLFARRSVTEQSEVLGHAQVLLAEKHFEGCGGLELTDEIRVTIAAQAARLLLNREDDYFPTVTSVLVYPAAVAHEAKEHLGGGIWEESESAAAGLATGHLGAIFLAWDNTAHGLAEPGDARDVILHEFAVLTEHFFERPIELRERHPALYAILRDFYRQDPAGSAA